MHFWSPPTPPQPLPSGLARAITHTHTHSWVVARSIVRHFRFVRTTEARRTRLRTSALTHIVRKMLQKLHSKTRLNFVNEFDSNINHLRSVTFSPCYHGRNSYITHARTHTHSENGLQPCYLQTNIHSRASRKHNTAKHDDTNSAWPALANISDRYSTSFIVARSAQAMMLHNTHTRAQFLRQCSGNAP